MRVLRALCCAAAITAMLAPAARGDEWNKKTILTFSGPVQIPGATLPTGSYVFKLADIPGNRHVVQVFDKDEKKLYTTLLAIPNQRLEPSDKPVILFSERASGSAQAGPKRRRTPRTGTPTPRIRTRTPTPRIRSRGATRTRPAHRARNRRAAACREPAAIWRCSS